MKTRTLFQLTHLLVFANLFGVAYADTIVGHGKKGSRTNTVCDLSIVQDKKYFPKIKQRTFFTESSQVPNNWYYNVELSKNNGLRLTDVKLGSRLFADKMDVNRYYVNYSNDDNKIGYKGHLTNDKAYSLTLIPYGDLQGVVASFVEGKSCLLMTQTFGFGPRMKDPEPSHLTATNSWHYWAAEVYPRFTYIYKDRSNAIPNYPKFGSVTVMQDFNFHSSPESAPGKLHNEHFLADVEITPTLNRLAPRVVNYSKPDSNQWFKVINRGVSLWKERPDYTNKEWKPEDFTLGTERFKWRPDNLHQTDDKDLDEPNAVLPGPGCPECVHTHWRWPVVAYAWQFFATQPLIPGPEREAWKVFMKHAAEKYGGGAAIINPLSKPAKAFTKGQDVYVGSYGHDDFKFTGTGRLAADTFFWQPIFYSPKYAGYWTQQ